MPFFGLGLHFIIALFFAVHAVRTGRPMYWLIILFSFPLLGSAVYLFSEYLPSSKIDRGIQKASNAALKILDPSRELRDARQAFDLTPTVQNRMRLAAALDNSGEYTEAAAQFDACLRGPFADDPEVCLGAAKAKLHNNQPGESILLLNTIRTKREDFRSEELTLLLANSYAAIGDEKAARAEFIKAMNKHGSAETLAQYALWAISVGDIETAERLREMLAKLWLHWNKHSRNLHKPLFNKLDAALQNTKQK